MTRRARRQLLVAVVIGVFVNSAGFYALIPQLAAATRDLGVTADVMGLLFGISSLMSLVLQLPMGVASDRYGRRWFMVVGIFITAIALGLRGSAHNVTVFAVSQALYGASGPLVFSAGLSAVADAFPAAERGRAIGLYQLGNTGGQLAGIAAAAATASIGWRGGAFLLLATTPIALVLALTMPETPVPGRAEPVRPMVTNVLRFLTRADALVLALLVTSCTAAGVAVVYLLPFAALAWRLPAVVSGLALVPFLLGAAAGGPLAAGLADRFGWRLPMVVVLGGSAAAAVVLGLVVPPVWLLALCLLVFGVAFAAGRVMSSTAVADLAQGPGGAGNGGALVGFRMGQTAGGSAAAPVAGVALVHSGVLGGFAVVGTAFALSLVLSELVARRPKSTLRTTQAATAS